MIKGKYELVFVVIFFVFVALWLIVSYNLPVITPLLSFDSSTSWETDYCYDKWVCTPWSSCSEGLQMRECSMKGSDCGAF